MNKMKREIVSHSDGNQTVSTSFKVDVTRNVRTDVVEELDATLGQLGGSVLHAVDPTRILPFSQGGPPVWSVGCIRTRGYTLLMTYGFSHIVSPDDEREGVHHEYSLAVPDGVPISPWADAFLRHQCRYILSQGADIRVNDCIPLHGVPITRIPFQPVHHAELPDSALVGVVCAADPVLPTIATAYGTIEVRRLLGIDALELDRVETWSVSGFLGELRKRDPLLLSPISRTSWMEDPEFRAIVNQRASDEGSECDAAVFDIAWSVTDRGVVVELPGGRAADGVRLRDALLGRVGFGRRLGAFSRTAPNMIAFEPERPGVEVRGNILVVGGGLEAPPLQALLEALDAGQRRVVFT
jgi:hypothetical protein